MSEVRATPKVSPHGSGSPRTVAGWTLHRLLGSGQFGSTWLAIDAMGVRAAVKLLAEPPGAEALALAAIAHPSVPRLLDSGGHPEPFMAMEQVDGEPITHVLTHGAMEAGRACHLAGQLFDALATVHQAGIVHGDIKPENLAISDEPSPRLWVLDFGMVGLEGGTRDYASPERLQGQASTAAGDVYAAGLVLWQLVHGSLPLGSLPPNERLRARLERAPEPTAGPPWLRELLTQLLQADPAARPTARHAVESLATAGYSPALPTADLLARRLQAASLDRGAVDVAVTEWEQQGGSLAILSAPRMGRSHQLAKCATRLAACGVSYVLISPTTRSWGAVEAALHSPTLPGSPRPLPNDVDVLDRAEKCVDALVSRGGPEFRVLVDDVDLLDRGSRIVVNSLIRRGGVPVLLAAGEGASVEVPTVQLLPLGPAHLPSLLAALLGGVGDFAALVRPMLELTGGRPSAVLDVVRHAVEAGIVARPTWRWTTDTARLPELRNTQWSEGLPALSAEAMTVGGLVALFEDSLAITGLPNLTGLPAYATEAAVGELVAAGVARRDRTRVRIDSLAMAVQLAAAHPEPKRAHAQLFALLSADQDADIVRRTWHAAQAGLRVKARALAPAAMVVAKTRDRATAVWLAESVHRCDPSEASTEALTTALLEDGQHGLAIETANAWLDGQSPTASQLGLRLALAKAVGGQPDGIADAAAILEQAQALVEGPSPLALIVALAQLAFRAKDHDEVLRLTSPTAELDSCDPADLSARLTLRAVRAQALHAEGHTEEALALLDLPSEGLSKVPEFALMQGVRGRLLWHDGQVRQAARVLDAAAQLPVGAVTRAQMANNAALALYSSGDVPRALDSWERAVGLFERLELHTDLVRALTNLVVGYKDAARWGRAIEAGERAYDLAMSMELPDLAAMCLGNLGDVALSRAQFTEAGTLYDRCQAIADEHELTGELIELSRRRAEMAVLLGSSDAESLALAAEKAATAAGMTGEALRAQVLAALCAARDGRRIEATQALADVLSVLKANGAARELAEVRVWAAEAWLALGDNAACIEELDRALAYADEAGLVALRARGDAVRARVAPPTAEPAESELEKFLAATAQLARHQDVTTLFSAAALAMRDLVGVERAFVLHECGESIEVAAYSGPQTGHDNEPSRTVVGRALRTGRPVMVTDLGEREDLREAESILALDLRFAACVPLRSNGRVVGAMYVDGPLIVERGLQRVSRVLSFLADHVAAALENVRAHRAARQRADEISEVGHDLRGMLLVIEANVHDVLLDAMATEDRTQIRALQDVLLATDRVQRLSDGLIRRYHTRDQRVDLTVMVEECLRWSAADARHRRVALTPELDGPIAVEGDPEELNRAVAHLLRSAIHHAKAGGVISVSVSADHGDAIVRLRDSGPGLPEADLDGLFTSDGTGRQTSQSAVGLAIARKIARAHGGGVDVANQSEGGVEFTMRVRAA